MKKIVRFFLLLPLLIFGISNNSYSQYTQTIKDSAQWYQYFHFELSFNYTSIVSGDTILNGRNYKKIVNQPVMIIGIPKMTFLREDTINKTIYQYNGSKEILFYDYNLTVGDTFKIYNIVLDSITDTFYYILISPQNMETHINHNKVFYFHSPSESYKYIIWVEGIGSLAGILEPSETPGEFNLLCHYNEKGIRDYHFNIGYKPNSCEGDIIGIKENNKTSIMNIYPNPITEILNIRFTEPQTGKLNIINNIGQLVKETSFSNQSFLQVNLSNQANSIYFLNIITNNDMFFEKIIKE